MAAIYQPKGKAREYSPLALNIYNGCDHGCKYCYVPDIFHKTKEEHLNVNERQDILSSVKRDCMNIKVKKQVLLSFTGDPYCHFNEEAKMTRKVLIILLENNFPVSILTKGGNRCLQDMDIFKDFGGNIKIGQTLTFFDKEKSLYSEPNASLPDERIETFRILKENNIKTWASIEPVVFPKESIKMIEKTLEYCDEYKIGKLNHFPKYEKQINWYLYLKTILNILRENNKKIYVKKDLAQFANGITLYPNELKMD